MIDHRIRQLNVADSARYMGCSPRSIRRRLEDGRLTHDPTTRMIEISDLQVLKRRETRARAFMEGRRRWRLRVKPVRRVLAQAWETPSRVLTWAGLGRSA